MDRIEQTDYCYNQMMRHRLKCSAWLKQWSDIKKDSLLRLIKRASLNGVFIIVFDDGLVEAKLGYITCPELWWDLEQPSHTIWYHTRLKSGSWSKRVKFLSVPATEYAEGWFRRPKLGERR